MKDIFGTVGFFVVAMATFRLVYGSWPPFEGDFGDWFSSEPRAKWAMASAVVTGMVGALLARAFSGILNKQEGKISTASRCARRGRRYHQQGKLHKAIDMFDRAIEIYTEMGRINDVASVYGSLGKAYFDKGDLCLSERNLKEALEIYKRRPKAQEAIETINVLLHLISERKLDTSLPSSYKNTVYNFAIDIPPAWLKQKLDPQFASTGGASGDLSHIAQSNFECFGRNTGSARGQDQRGQS